MTQFHLADKQIHICWYCISISSARVLPYDLENIAFLTQEKRYQRASCLLNVTMTPLEGSIAKSLSEVIGQKFGRHIHCFKLLMMQKSTKN